MYVYNFTSDVYDIINKVNVKLREIYKERMYKELHQRYDVNWDEDDLLLRAIIDDKAVNIITIDDLEYISVDSIIEKIDFVLRNDLTEELPYEFKYEQVTNVIDEILPKAMLYLHSLDFYTCLFKDKPKSLFDLLVPIEYNAEKEFLAISNKHIRITRINNNIHMEFSKFSEEFNRKVCSVEMYNKFTHAEQYAIFIFSLRRLYDDRIGSNIDELLNALLIYKKSYYTKINMNSHESLAKLYSNYIDEFINKII